MYNVITDMGIEANQYFYKKICLYLKCFKQMLMFVCRVCK